jgi:cellulose synthase/poly-beta-1,6-N-acetylglucosamine synthase-like glycosyltransferase
MDTVTAAAFQQYPGKRFQVFVLDDAPDKHLQQAIGAFNASSGLRQAGNQDVVYFAREKVRGERSYYKSGNLRAGLEFTKSQYGSSEFFAALDADMIPSKDWLSRTVPHLIKEIDVALVSPPQQSYNILDDDRLGQDTHFFRKIFEPYRDFFGSSQCSGSGYVMRRNALDTIGGWPLANIGEDILCSYLLQEQGWKTRYIPDDLQFGLAPDSFHSFINQRIRWVSLYLFYRSLPVRFLLTIFRRMAVSPQQQTSACFFHSSAGAVISPPFNV